MVGIIGHEQFICFSTSWRAITSSPAYSVGGDECSRHEGLIIVVAVPLSRLPRIPAATIAVPIAAKTLRLPRAALTPTDPLRVLRAVRFATRFGFELEQTLLEAAASKQVRNVAAKRAKPVMHPIGLSRQTLCCSWSTLACWSRHCWKRQQASRCGKLKLALLIEYIS